MGTESAAFIGTTKNSELSQSTFQNIYTTNSVKDNVISELWTFGKLYDDGK